MKFLRLPFYHLAWLLLRLFLKIFTGYRVKFKAPLPKKGPLLIVANHLSFLDPLLVGTSFPFFSKIHPIYFITQDVLMEKPILGLLLKALGGFPAKKGQGLEVSLATPKKLLEQGKTVVFFPQGRRQQIFDVNQGRVGSAVLALDTKTPILPLAIIDSAPGSIKKFILRKRKIKVVVGQAFTLKQENLPEATKEIMQKIGQLLNN